jgi:diguanylate cyclase (GGDEF)-like protein
MNPIRFEPDAGGALLPEHTAELLAVLDQVFLSVVKLDLQTGRAWLLQSCGQQNRQPYDFDWDAYLRFYQSVVEPEEAEKLREDLAFRRLEKLYAGGNRRYRVHFACRPETEVDCLEIAVRFLQDEETPAAYVFTRQSGDNYLLRRIIDLYVYSNCDCFYYLDAEHNCCTMFNGKEDTPLPPAVCTDYSSEIVRYAEMFVVPEERDMVVREMSLERVLTVLERQEVHAFTCGMWDKDGNYTRKQMEYRYYDRKRRMILLTRTDITMLYEEQQRHTRELEEALLRAQTDPLTGLWNYQGIQAAVSAGLDGSGTNAALLFLDLDNFKTINDTYGHAAGDDALQSVADILRQSIRAGDHAARVGGDEFVVFLGGRASVGEVEDCARQICRRLAEVWPEGAAVRLSGSIGVAVSPKDGTDYGTLVKNADRKSYRAKSDGKNRFVI